MPLRKEEKPRPQLMQECALRYVVRDMGNGVDRVESAAIVPIDHALIEASLPDRMIITLHPGSRLASLSRLVVTQLGYETDKTRPCVLDGVARPVDEYAIEILCWCKD